MLLCVFCIMLSTALSLVTFLAIIITSLSFFKIQRSSVWQKILYFRENRNVMPTLKLSRMTLFMETPFIIFKLHLLIFLLT